MTGSRRINGVNWLNPVYTKTIIEDGNKTVETIGKLPLHWTKVRNILLTNH
ncbi:hypothetical protein [Limosilactobacillus vaginalis]|uniref:hypothetical protein n=1 Tax=Limosilactobacillus vaginalis TaxID=1633 RepID=UPI0022E827D9|nr:hypothetical protein [Limosilactobacillus vaginalis]